MTSDKGVNERHQRKGPGFFRRLVRSKEKEAASDALWSLYSHGAWSVNHEEIRSLEARYNILVHKDLRDQCLTILKRELQQSYKDQQISDDDRAALEHLIAVLAINDHDVRTIAQSVQHKIYRDTVREVFSGDYPSSSQIDRLNKLETTLVIPSDIALELRRSEGVQELIENHERQIQFETRQEILRQYEELPLVPVDIPIRLQKTEACYFSTPANWNEIRSRTRKINYNGPSARIRIAKGIYWNMGSIDVESIKEDVLTPVSSGMVHFTNKRIIFTGHNRSTNIRLNRVLDFIPYSEGIEVVKDSGYNPFFLMDSDIDIAAIVLNRLLAGDPALDRASGEPQAG